MNFWKCFYVIVCFVSWSNLVAQPNAVANFNETQFCGQNNILTLADNSTGTLVSTRLWNVSGPVGFTNFSSTSATSSVNLSEVGTYQVKLFVCDAANNCDSVLNTIEVFQAPTLSLSTTSFCAGTPNRFDAVYSPATLTIDSFKWDFGEPGAKYDGTSTEFYTFNTSGNKIVSLQVATTEGCRDTISQSINVSTKPQAVLDISDTLVCSGTTINLSATNSTYNTVGASYVWDVDYNTGVDNTSSTFFFQASANATIMLVVADDSNCTDTVFQDIQVVQTPEIDFSVSRYCVNNPINLQANITNASPLDSVYWLVDNTTYLQGATATYSHPKQDSIPIVAFIQNQAGCPDTAIQYAVIDTLPFINLLSQDTGICLGESLEIGATSNVNLLWLPDSIVANTINLSPTENTQLEVRTLAPGNVCPSVSKTVSIDVLLPPDISVTASDTSVGIGTPVDLELTYSPQYSTNDTIHWLDSNSSNELENEYGSKTSFTAKESASFPVALIYKKGNARCTFSSDIKINVNVSCAKDNIYIPNVFSPDGNGKNETFKIKGYSLQSIDLFVIYNRLGQEVYRVQNVSISNGIAEAAWDGLNKKGIECNNGVYVYSYQATCVNGATTNGAGNITLIR